MGDKFIYVFDEKSKDTLLKAGWILLKEDKRNSVYIFDSSNKLEFDLRDIVYVVSDILTF